MIKTVHHDKIAGYVAGEHLLVGAIDHDQLLNYVAGEHFLQSAITEVGTIATGVWSGTALIAAKVPNHDNLNGFVANEHIDWTASPAGKSIAVASGQNISDGTASLRNGDLTIGAKVKYNGDATTYLEFDTHSFDLSLEGTTLIYALLGDVYIGNGASDADVKIYGNGKDALVYDWGDDTFLYNSNVGIGISPDVPLHVATEVVNSNTYFDTYNADEYYRNANIIIRRSHSDTLGTKTETEDADVLGQIDFNGVDSGGNFDRGARIRAKQNGAAGTKVPTDLYIYTHNDTTFHGTQLVLHHDGGVGVGTATPAADAFEVGGDSVRIITSQTPASNGTGLQGEIAWDADYIYVCTATNTWERAALTGGY